MVTIIKSSENIQPWPNIEHKIKIYEVDAKGSEKKGYVKKSRSRSRENDN